MALFKKFAPKLEYLPFWTLMMAFLLLVSRLMFTDPVLVYDEIVVTEISKQPTLQLLDTIKAEPHPPLFYLVLKVFSGYPDKVTKTIVLTASFVLSFLVLVYLKKTQLLKKHRLSLGLSFLFGSYNFLSISTTIKQDAVSVPLFLFFLATALYLFDKRNRQNRKHLLLAHFLTTSLLGFGYILYFQALAIITMVTFLLKRKKLSSALLITQFILLGLFLKSWGYKQMLINQNRFVWVSENYNSLVRSLSFHLTGIEPVVFFADILTIGAIGLVLFFAYGAIKGLPKINLRLVVLLLIIILTVAAYLSQSFVRIRYVFSLFALISLAMGWALEDMVHKKKAFLVAIIPFLLFGASGFFVSQLQSDREISHRIEIYKELIAKDRYGVIDTNNGGLSAQAVKTKYSLGENIVPINIYFPGLYEGKVGIDQGMLAKEGQRPFRLTPRIAAAFLLANQLENFVYIAEDKDKKAHVDDDLIIHNVL